MTNTCAEEGSVLGFHHNRKWNQQETKGNENRRIRSGRPYTVVAVLIIVCLLAAGAAWRMPIDIFPEINIPVVSVVWTYNG